MPVRSTLFVLLALALPVSAQWIGPFSIAPATPVPAFSNSDSAVVDDFNGDGIGDLVVTQTAPPTAALMLGDTVGGLLPPLPFPMTAWGPVLSADVNGDGFRDVIVSSVEVHLGIGNGAFSATLPVPASTTPSLQTFAIDLDVDGKDEVLRAVAPAGPGAGLQLEIARETGGALIAAGTLAYPPPTPNGTLRLSLRQQRRAWGDANGDGYRDLAAFNQGPAAAALDLVLLPGTGTLAAGAPIVRSAGAYVAVDVALADIDGDGYDDLVAWAQPTGVVQDLLLWARGNPVSGLGPVSVLTTLTTNVFGLAFEDFTGDGHLDILTEHIVIGPFAGATVLNTELRLGDSSGTFSQPFSSAAASMSGLPRLALDPFDQDGDGDTDLIVVMASLSILSGPLEVSVSANASITGAGCAGPSGTPTIAALPARIGNALFALRTGNTAGNALAVVGASLGMTPAGSPCGGPLIDLSPASLILPAGPFGFTTTNAFGVASLPLPLPFAPALQGLFVWTQWAVDDGGTLALSPILRVMIW